MKKCDEQVKIVDEQASGAKMEGKMREERLKKVWTELTEFSELQA